MTSSLTSIGDPNSNSIGPPVPGRGGLGTGGAPGAAAPAAATSGALVKATALTAATVNKSLAHLERLGIVSELTNRQRGRVFAYRRYVEGLAADPHGWRDAANSTFSL